MEQASMLKLPLQRLFISEKCTTEEYVKTIRDLLKKFAKTGIKTIAFGDSQNEEDKLFHEQIVHPIEIKAIFPLWKMNLEKLNLDLINSGYKALVTAIDTRKLDNSYLNCEYNLEYVNKLSDKNLIHTFVIYGPTYKTRIAFSKSIAVMEGPYLVSLIKGP
jgi:diphthamide synthase (EF-2-diphthine--ammonia ligase)